MNLSKFTDYAFRSCLYLATRPGTLVSIGEIARAHEIPLSSVMKVVNQLVDGGILSSTRGRAGGVELARPAADITIGEIARLMENDGPIVDCTSCLIEDRCGVFPVLDVAKAAFYTSLDQISLERALRSHAECAPVLLERASMVGQRAPVTAPSATL
ncbi:Rrf2 family transcriptional regulator [Pararhodobacter sp. CCB-MM2]|uniref:RrF2 family transcriptional regulator n=1 Tax=Pararhodobacter sp. CCB-MM2 TaxID=1786003 RepID=UPI000833CCDA|nr:Rrf2 family transcriptional regulator [Pararhodobacter sp. CCB-MM2]